MQSVTLHPITQCVAQASRSTRMPRSTSRLAPPNRSASPRGVQRARLPRADGGAGPGPEDRPRAVQVLPGGHPGPHRGRSEVSALPLFRVRQRFLAKTASVRLCTVRSGSWCSDMISPETGISPRPSPRLAQGRPPAIVQARGADGADAAHRRPAVQARGHRVRGSVVP